MLFSLFGEIGLVVIGLLYVGNLYMDSCITLIESIKNNDEETKLSDVAKRMYS